MGYYAGWIPTNPLLGAAVHMLIAKDQRQASFKQEQQQQGRFAAPSTFPGCS